MTLKVVKHVRAWFQQRMLEAVSPKWLAVCAKAYRPPKGGFGLRGKKVAHPVGSTLWLIGLNFSEPYPEDEIAVERQGAAQAKRKLSNPSRFTVQPIRWAGRYSFLESNQKGRQSCSDYASR